MARFDAAMQIVTFKDYCVSCHIVADYRPGDVEGGSERAIAPDLADVYKRLRSDYVRDWIARPNRILPYTPMPAVIPYKGAANELVPQDLYHGTPTQQLDAVVDLLMNFDRYLAGQSSIAPMVKAPATQPEGTDQVLLE